MNFLLIKFQTSTPMCDDKLCVMTTPMCDDFCVMTNLKYICSTSIHESALKNDILKSRSREKDKH